MLPKNTGIQYQKGRPKPQKGEKQDLNEGVDRFYIFFVIGYNFA
jgi:hypothetical protein